MKKNGKAIVRIAVENGTRSELDLLDLARRQCDHLGPHGLRAKKGQTNRSYRRRGYLRMQFPSRELARAYIRRLRRLREPGIIWRLMRSLGRYD